MMPSNNTSAWYTHVANGTRLGRCHPMPFCQWTRNDWMEVDEFEKHRVLSLKIFYIFIIVFAILGNCLVLVATWKEKYLHQPNKYFIACLAVADLLVGMFVVPLRFYQLHLTNKSKSAISIHLLLFMFWIDNSVITVSIYTLTIISFDRYLKISKPLQYKLRMTTSRSLKIIFAICIFSASFAVYLTIPRASSVETLISSSDKDLKKEIQTILAMVSFFVPTTVMLVMYVLIFIVAHQRQKMLRNGELGQISNARNQQTALRQDVKVIRMLLLVVGVFIVAWGPFFTSWLLYLYYPNFPDYDETSLSYWMRLNKINTAIMDILPLFNSVCNPIIYAWLDLTYRKAFKHLFQRMRCW